MKYSKGWGAVLFIMLLLLLDQSFKFWIKTHLQLGESIYITSWFQLYFTENPGMAFGMQIFGKLFLTLFRIVAIGFIGYYLYTLVKRKFSTGFVLCVAMIFAGAMGNIIDSVFYGAIFNSSVGQVATFMPEEGGYSTWLYGNVVDMLYFPLIDSTFPDWLPFWGGEPFVFFHPIFNLADSFICVGVFILLIFYRHTLSASLIEEKKEEKEEQLNAE